MAGCQTSLGCRVESINKTTINVKVRFQIVRDMGLITNFKDPQGYKGPYQEGSVAYG